MSLEYFASISHSSGNNTALEGNTSVQKSTKLGAHLGSIISSLECRGLFESIYDGAPTRGGKPIPLLTFPFLDFIENHDWSEWSFVEFGSGNSTIWFEKVFGQVISFETNQQWYEKVKEKITRVDYRKISIDDLEAGNYELTTVNYKLFVLIDSGCNRRRVCRQLLKKMRPVILALDNSEWYPNTSSDIRSDGYLEVPLWGYKCSEHWESCTSIFIDLDTSIALAKNDTFPPPLARKMNNAWDE